MGKNIYTLISYFEQYKKRMQNDMKLVLIGGGEVEIPESIREDVYDLGFVDIQDKYDITAAATLLCQPSKMKAFRLLSWKAGFVGDRCLFMKPVR